VARVGARSGQGRGTGQAKATCAAERNSRAQASNHSPKQGEYQAPGLGQSRGAVNRPLESPGANRADQRTDGNTKNLPGNPRVQRIIAVFEHWAEVRIGLGHCGCHGLSTFGSEGRCEAASSEPVAGQQEGQQQSQPKQQPGGVGSPQRLWLIAHKVPPVVSDTPTGMFHDFMYGLITVNPAVQQVRQAGEFQVIETDIIYIMRIFILSAADPTDARLHRISVNYELWRRCGSNPHTKRPIFPDDLSLGTNPWHFRYILR